ncbi:ribosomal protein l1 [Grosmannia clavigera kw1407]|uniref:Ribosomal protein l1 n=1 Tax=Grosmannia clavigera (strain kw1407 / UAMH 11150) TaxID=655863 RepID=F0X835_GROCL|nr:ribosomal protein l1 [Grosmannia clavigera kw1407]EFX05901.1 ribosomal protein l1 [Grosmannia clavigera kw1407]
MSASKDIATADASAPLALDAAQVLTASKALLSHIKESAKAQKEKSGKKNLLDESDGEGEQGMAGSTAETPIWLTLTTKQHVNDSRRLQPSKLVVPYPLNTDEESTICIITADPQRAYKNIVASDEFPAELRKRISRVIDLSHLQKKFKAYEAQRKLFAEHDVFVADERIVNRLPSVLGKTFYKSTAKRPIPVVLQKARAKGADGKRAKAPKKKASGGKTAAGTDERAVAVEEATSTARSAAQIATEIQRAIGSVLISLSPSTNTAVRVGSAGWPAAHLAANVEAVVEALVSKHVPKGWSNIKALFIKGRVGGGQGDRGQEDNQRKAAAAASREKANVGKKRKAVTDDDKDDEKKHEAGTFGAGVAEEQDKAEAEDVQTKKKGKKAVKGAAAKEDRPAKKAKLPESNDSGLDKVIAEHKAKLKKQKSAAKKALDI